MSETIIFPECFYFGELYSVTYGSLPVYLPSSEGGFCLCYHNGEEDKINRQIESSVLCLLEDIPMGLLDIHIVDFALKPNFPFLSQLSGAKLYHLHANEDAAWSAFNYIEKTISHRYHSLFSSKYYNINQYNLNAKRPENYICFIVNTTYFYFNNISEQRLRNLLKDAYGAGVYIIFIHNDDIENENLKNTLQVILDYLPRIKIDSKNLVCDEKLIPIRKLSKLGFYFNPVNINQSEILHNIRLSLLSHKDEDSDFLQVKVGEFANGEAAYFCLGKRSGNYSGLLIGATGTGKSSLMNNLIVKIGEKYTSQEIILYLMDYKQGNEFKSFDKHPNVKFLFANKDSMSGIKLLEGLVTEQNHRYAKLAEKSNIKDIDQYNKAYPSDPIPHILLIVDEFQVMFDVSFSEQDKLNSLIQLVAQQGRAAGIHLLLSTQSMQGVRLAPAAKQQLGLRIAYYVDEGALFDVVDSQFRQTVKSLEKYQALFQVKPSTAHCVFIDKPIDIEKSIEKILDARPDSQCLTPIVFTEKEIASNTEKTLAYDEHNSMLVYTSVENNLDWLKKNQQRSQDEKELLNKLVQE